MRLSVTLGRCGDEEELRRRYARHSCGDGVETMRDECDVEEDKL